MQPLLVDITDTMAIRIMDSSSNNNMEHTDNSKLDNILQMDSSRTDTPNNSNNKSNPDKKLQAGTPRATTDPMAGGTMVVPEALIGGINRFSRIENDVMSCIYWPRWRLTVEHSQVMILRTIDKLRVIKLKFTYK